jgi:MraZ protein
MELKTGTFETTLDDKGRVSVPVRLRERYQGELVITWGTQPCAWIMTPQVWEQVSAKLTNSDTISEDVRFLMEYAYEYQAQAVEIDKVGRIAIPVTIRKYARLTKDCLVISAENRLEIWDAGYFYTYLEENRPVIQEAIKKMGSLKLFKMD